jgi:hypothetical protein
MKMAEKNCFWSLKSMEVELFFVMFNLGVI